MDPAEYFRRSVRFPKASVGSGWMNEPILIVGMKYHPGSFIRLQKASQRNSIGQCLFLLPDVHNKFDKNAVMLHNGQGKIGYVSAVYAPQIKAYIMAETKKQGCDQVLVVNINEYPTPDTAIVKVKLLGVVFERIARKHAQALLRRSEAEERDALKQAFIEGMGFSEEYH